MSRITFNQNVQHTRKCYARKADLETRYIILTRTATRKQYQTFVSYFGGYQYLGPTKYYNFPSIKIVKKTRNS